MMRPENYPPAVRAELEFINPIGIGASGMPAKRVQEWLSFHGFRTSIDSDFGTATREAVRSFQAANQLPTTGVVDLTTWKACTQPLHSALTDATGITLRTRVAAVAMQHTRVHPIELGGDNRGPWVRVYTNGHDGPDWKWCAGFVSFVLRQACAELGVVMPIEGSVSCDTLAAQAERARLLVTESQLAQGQRRWEELGAAYVFLVRRTPGDWTHTGFGLGGAPTAFNTAEGNTNDEGSSNGFEVCSRIRSAASKDFIALPV
jgi:peptidoglycan hydrolase-like protein with peptidoglycan-binding domain